MLKFIQGSVRSKIGSFSPQLLSQQKRGLYWAPKQYFLPESQIARMKRLIVSQYDGKPASKLQSLKITAKYLLKVSLYLVAQGTKQFIKDVKWRIALFKDPVKKRQMTGWEIKELNRTNWDFAKFVPFFLLLVVPFGEFVLPVYIYLLPNGNPSYFTYDLMYHENSHLLEKKQQKAYEKLYSMFHKTILPSKNKQVLLDPDLSEELFRKSKAKINRQLNFHNFSSDQLLLVSDLFGMKPIAGTLIINRIVNLFTMYIPRLLYKLYRAIRYYKAIPPPYKDPFFVKGDFKLLKLNFYPFQFFKRRLLIFQIQRHLNRITRQDRAFEMNGYHKLVKQRIVHFTRDRGLVTLKCYKASINFYIQDWIYKTNADDFTNNERIWYAVLMHSFLKENPDFYIEDQ